MQLGKKKTPRETAICPGALNSSLVTQRDSDRSSEIFRRGLRRSGGRSPALPSAPRSTDVPGKGPALSIPGCSPGQPTKLVFKRFSWRHKGLLTSLMPPFNTELFHIPSRLRFYSEWQGTFPLGKLEKCFFFFFFLFLPFQLASIFHPNRRGWWWQLRRQRANAWQKLTAGAFRVAGDDDDDEDGAAGDRGDPRSPSLR